MLDNVYHRILKLLKIVSEYDQEIPQSQIVSEYDQKYHNHKPQTTPWHTKPLKSNFCCANNQYFVILRNDIWEFITQRY